LKLEGAMELKWTWKRTKAMRLTKQPSPQQIMIDQKEPVNVECFNCFSTIITNDARSTHEMKSPIAMAKGTLIKKTLFTRKLDLNLRKKPHLEHDFLWC